MERTGIEPVASDLQIPESGVELGQVGLIKAKLWWLGEVGSGYPGTRFGTRFDVVSGNTAAFDVSGAGDRCLRSRLSRRCTPPPSSHDGRRTPAPPLECSCVSGPSVGRRERCASSSASATSTTTKRTPARAAVGEAD